MPFDFTLPADRGATMAEIVGILPEFGVIVPAGLDVLDGSTGSACFLAALKTAVHHKQQRTREQAAAKQRSQNGGENPDLPKRSWQHQQKALSPADFTSL